MIFQNLEPATEPPEGKEIPRCSQCDEFENLIWADAKLYCHDCFKKLFCKAATDKERRAFIRENPDLWCDFFAESIDNEHLDKITPRFLDALREMVGSDYFEREFCETWAEDEFANYIKKEVA